MKFFVFAAAVAAISITVVPSFSRNTKVDEVSREEYIQHVEAELTDWTKQADRLRTERDQFDMDQFGFKVREKAVEGMEKAMSQARSDLKDLKRTQNPSWTQWRSRIDRRLSEIRKAYQSGQVAE